MAYEGILANALVTLFAAACYLYVGAEARRSRAIAGSRSRAGAAFFLTVAVYLVLAGLRQAAAYAGTLNPDLAVLDLWIYHVTIIPAGFTIVPLAYLTVLATWGMESRARVAGGLFAAIATLGLALVYAGGITGPTLSAWGSEWSINSAAAQVMLVLFLTVPALIASALLVYAGSHSQGPSGRRLRLLGWSCLIYYTAFTLDAFGLTGWALLAARLATAAAAVLGYVAYARAGPDPAGALGAPSRNA